MVTLLSKPRTSASNHTTMSKQPTYYVPLPSQLLNALRDTPLAIGVYALVARVYRATKAPVPLSPADVATYDPAISAAAARRALARLQKQGYLKLVPFSGRSNAYIPTWGLVNGQARLWALDASCLGCPRHIRTQHVPQDLLDVCIGRLDPHANRGANVRRYLTAPLLSLIDVGAYALNAASYPTASPTLVQLGLLVGGKAMPLPAKADILALATQRRLFDAGSPVALTEAGWAQLGLAPDAEVATGRPLVFVPPEQGGNRVGHPAGNPVGSDALAESRSSASQRPRGRFVPPAERSHGSERKKGRKETTPQPPTTPCAEVGGGDSSTSPNMSEKTVTAAQETGQDTNPENAVVSRLRQIGVNPSVALTLADRAPAQIERVIAQARAHKGVRDVAAWVVAVLRTLPVDEPEAPPSPPKVSDLVILGHPELTTTQRSRWIARFRNADAADRPAVLTQLLAEHPLDVSAAPVS